MTDNQTITADELPVAVTMAELRGQLAAARVLLADVCDQFSLPCYEGGYHA